VAIVGPGGGQRTAVSIPVPGEPPVTIARLPLRSIPATTSPAVEVTRARSVSGTSGAGLMFVQ
jgi:hypothetical protein